MAKKEVWKLQRPLFGDGDVLAYTEDRDRTAIIQMSKKDMDKLFGDELKVYAWAHSNGKNLVIDGLVEDEWW